MSSTSVRSLYQALVCAMASLIAQPASAAQGIFSDGFEVDGSNHWFSQVPPSSHSNMVFIPAGEFTMGSSLVPGSDQAPAHTVYLDAYWIDRTEVTVGRHGACVVSGGCSTPNGAYPYEWCNYGDPEARDRPVNCVDWYKAQSYCTWAGGHLPTEAQWEKAARGTDARTYPWGEAAPTCDYAVFGDPVFPDSGCGLGRAWPVGSKPSGASPYGALDMAGNVGEMVSDWYSATYYSASPYANPTGPTTGGSKAFRNGAWGSHPSYLVSTVRLTGFPSSWGSSGGFRCARDD